MELTRIIQPYNRTPGLYLLGGAYSLDGDAGESTPSVWELMWNSTSQSYYWKDGLDPPMGGLHLLYSSHTSPYRDGV